MFCILCYILCLYPLSSWMCIQQQVHWLHGPSDKELDFAWKILQKRGKSKSGTVQCIRQATQSVRAVVPGQHCSVLWTAFSTPMQFTKAARSLAAVSIGHSTRRRPVHVHNLFVATAVCLLWVQRAIFSWQLCERYWPFWHIFTLLDYRPDVASFLCFASRRS